MKKKSRLLKLLKMDLHRCIGAKRFPVIIALIVVLLIANVWESVMIELQYKMRMMGSLEKLMELLIFDRFKAAVIVLLSAVYTFGLCDDRNSSYGQIDSVSMQARRVSAVKADFQCNRGCVSSLYKLCTIFNCTIADYAACRWRWYDAVLWLLRMCNEFCRTTCL